MIANRPRAAKLARHIVFALLLGAALGPAACLSLAPEVVGASCSNDGQCQRTCLRGNPEFPNGLCTRPCATDDDCPAGAICIAQNNGVCAEPCRVDRDCYGNGANNRCRLQTRQGGTVTTPVCTGN